VQRAANFVRLYTSAARCIRDSADTVRHSALLFDYSYLSIRVSFYVFHLGKLVEWVL